ncbi:MAG: DUF1214 domain-containing protein [Bacteroidota bacterium]
MSKESKTALAEFIEMLGEADQTFLDPDKEVDSQGQIDGYYHFFHLLQIAVEFYMHNDPLKPHFAILATPHRKVYGDNVDAVYYFTQLKSDQEYVIRGKRYDSVYLSFSLYGGEPNGEYADRVTLNVNHRDIEFEEDGSFEIKFTANPQGKNEFKMDEDVVTLFTREYFFDRFNSKESDLHIENLTPQAKAQPITDRELSRRIRAMTEFFRNTTYVAPLPVQFPMNDFLPPFPFEADTGGWGTVDNIYCFGRFHLKQNQYLKIRFTSPECCYWGVQTWNYFMQSMDYRDHNVAINKGNATPNDDGSFTIYVSHKEASQNWISTGGYEEAIIFCRWLLADEMPETPEVELLEWK